MEGKQGKGRSLRERGLGATEREERVAICSSTAFEGSQLAWDPSGLSSAADGQETRQLLLSSGAPLEHRCGCISVPSDKETHRSGSAARGVGIHSGRAAQLPLDQVQRLPPMRDMRVCRYAEAEGLTWCTGVRKYILLSFISAVSSSLEVRSRPEEWMGQRLLVGR